MHALVSIAMVASVASCGSPPAPPVSEPAAAPDPPARSRSEPPVTDDLPGQALFEAALDAAEAGDLKSMQQAFSRWRQTYGDEPGNERDVVFSWHVTAEALERAGDVASADRARSELVRAWDELGEPRGRSAHYAAEANFVIVEREHRRFVDYDVSQPLSGDTDTVRARHAAIEARAKTLPEHYDEMARFEVVRWTVAAHVRRGDVHSCAAAKIRTLPRSRKFASLAARMKKRNPSLDFIAEWDRFVGNLAGAFERRAQTLWSSAVDMAGNNADAASWARDRDPAIGRRSRVSVSVSPHRWMHATGRGETLARFARNVSDVAP